MPKIYIIGFMGSGKSFTGKKLASRLGYKFFDIDPLFEEKYHFTIHDFFEKFGEQPFRKLEKDLLLGTEYMENTVISTGGGTPCYYENMKFIKDNGLSIYIHMSPEKILSRIHQSKKPRPLLKNLEGKLLLQKIREMLQERELYYRQADIVVDAVQINPPDIINAILDNLKKRSPGEFTSLP
jgi:shikimate kinase